MDESKRITVEGQSVNIREWRMWLCVEELRSLTRQMELDLKRARSMLAYQNPQQTVEKPKVSERTRKLAAKRIISDDED